jgi:hypothetical protein
VPLTIYGYARVSTDGQRLDAHIVGGEAPGAEKVASACIGRAGGADRPAPSARAAPYAHHMVPGRADGRRITGAAVGQTAGC